MYLEENMKSKFAQINDKRYYFCNGIVSLPIFHPHLKKIMEFKLEKKVRIEMYEI